MKRPTILAGIAFAFVAAVFAIPIWWGLRVALPATLAFRIVALSGYLVYCAYLIRTAKTRVGALSLAVANLVVGLVLAFMPLSTLTMVGALAILVSINRSLLFQRSLVAMALDGVTSVTGLIFAGYLFNETGSVVEALWSYFLVQSIFVVIPPRFPRECRLLPEERAEAVDSFVHGQRQAEAALERIVQIVGE
jgi:hypothetical protein